MTTSRTARRTVALAATLTAVLFSGPAIGAAHAADRHAPHPPREAHAPARPPLTLVAAARTTREPRATGVGAA